MSFREPIASSGVNTAGAILSGGLNKRMEGKDKAFIEIGGVLLIQRILTVFKNIFDEIILVTNTPASYRPYAKDFRIISDKIVNIGPLGGIHSALLSTSKKSVFFIAIDMPFLHNGLIEQQIERFNKCPCQALIPKIGSFLEPLHAIYSASLADKIESYVQSTSSYSIRGFLKAIDTRYFELPDTKEMKIAFTNLNTPADIDKIKSDES